MSITSVPWEAFDNIHKSKNNILHSPSHTPIFCESLNGNYHLGELCWGQFHTYKG